MTRLGEWKWIKARKEHMCDTCHFRITVGTRYRREAFLIQESNDSFVVVSKSHGSCLPAVI